jgi:hypothetical protein
MQEPGLGSGEGAHARALEGLTAATTACKELAEKDGELECLLLRDGDIVISALAPHRRWTLPWRRLCQREWRKLCSLRAA